MSCGAQKTVCLQHVFSSSGHYTRRSGTRSPGAHSNNVACAGNGTFIAIARVIGTARAISAAGSIVSAIELVDKLAHGKGALSLPACCLVDANIRATRRTTIMNF